MLASLPMLSDIAAVLAVSDRTEARTRSPGTAPPTTSVDLETAPIARLTLTSRSTRYVVAYTPRLTLWDLGSSRASPVGVNAGLARVEWTAPRTLVSVEETASYGGVSLASIAPAPGPDGAPPRVDVVPSTQVVDVMASQTTLASRLTFQGWSTALAVGYQIGGGATAEARTVLPRQSGPFGEVGVTRDLLRTDSLTTTVTGSEAAFSSGPESLLVEATERWRHLWSRVTETRLSAGASEARVRATASAPHTLETHPVVEAILEQHLPTDDGRLDVRVGVRLGPFVNRLIGFVDERVVGTLAITRTSGRIAGHAYASAAQSVPAGDPTSVRLVTGELGASYGLSDAVTLDAGVRGLWQRQDPALPDLKQATVFVGVTVRAPTTKL